MIAAFVLQLWILCTAIFAVCRRLRSKHSNLFLARFIFSGRYRYRNTVNTVGTSHLIKVEFNGQ